MTRHLLFLVLILCACANLPAQEDNDLPTNEKAQKSYKEGLDYLQQRQAGMALDDFKKADKQSGGHCLPCERKMIKYGVEFGDWKTAGTACEEIIADAQSPRDKALAHYQFALVLMEEGLNKRKDDPFRRVHEEITEALTTSPNFPQAIFLDGRALAHVNQDDAAKAQFQRYVELAKTDDPDRQRALRYIADPELARARMAPAFAVTTTDGQKISLDDLKGKVVLLDFWATWCGPCRESIPHMREIAKHFDGEPLVMLSVSLDDNESKWKDFVAQNGMTWKQYRDGGFKGPIATLFGVEAIPHTFTIDADGVLQDEHIGDASIEGKLKKLVGRAREMQGAEKSAP